MEGWEKNKKAYTYDRKDKWIKKYPGIKKQGGLQKEQKKIGKGRQQKKRKRKEGSKAVALELG